MGYDGRPLERTGDRISPAHLKGFHIETGCVRVRPPEEIEPVWRVIVLGRGGVIHTGVIIQGSDWGKGVKFRVEDVGRSVFKEEDVPGSVNVYGTGVDWGLRGGKEGQGVVGNWVSVNVAAGCVRLSTENVDRVEIVV